MLAHVRFQPITNRETWLDRVEIRDENGAVIDLSDADARLEVRTQPDGTTVLSARSGDGVLSTSADGIIEWQFPDAKIRALPPGLYSVGLVYTLNGITTQVLTGEIEVQDGVVS